MSRTSQSGTGSESATISVTGLTKEFSSSDGTVTAVNDVSFRIDRGEIVGVLGPNGAGKTTTIKSILGLLEPTTGSIEVNGIDVAESSREIYNEVGGLLEGARNLYWRLTVRENLRYFTGLQGIRPDGATDRHDRLLSLVNLEEKADERVRNLSRGMKQKACLACVLARSTPIVFLDEPTLGLDIEASRDLRSELRRLATEENRTIVISSHDMDVVQDICDRVLVFQDGEIIVDDHVETLLDELDIRRYRVVLKEPVPTGESLDGYDLEWSADRMAFEVILRNETDVYEFVETLRRSEMRLKKLRAVEGTLETVFLSALELEDDGPAPDGLVAGARNERD
ncbi:ABC transporter ATP-binding protein [Haloarcula sp. S1CR25-12]|uniref:ABC transporter ATP-binding protein n=1 Tax=Haloarcula saliterrae TaxID=2950534 RepID=A0ABU2FF39_9EURY|nr:ABC transporter ATP-binding protein [Haloarcula sp. S1CR25-12]MDS0260330.1 ABC transporter ATP-binding protein [Haloarcula sp. S1CR25-12]